jgi:hypothetical protein
MFALPRFRSDRADAFCMRRRIELAIGYTKRAACRSKERIRFIHRIEPNRQPGTASRFAYTPCWHGHRDQADVDHYGYKHDNNNRHDACAHQFHNWFGDRLHLVYETWQHRYADHDADDL